MKIWHAQIYEIQLNLKGNFIAINDYIKKQERSQINNLTLHLKELKKKEQTKLKFSRRKESIKSKKEINGIETKKAIKEIKETKFWFFEKK